MNKYRIYETMKNAGGGYDSLQSGNEYFEANTAHEAAELAAEDRRDNVECEGITVVATDDNGESAYVYV